MPKITRTAPPALAVEPPDVTRRRLIREAVERGDIRTARRLAGAPLPPGADDYDPTPARRGGAL